MIHLPPPVYGAIAEHLRTKGQRLHRDWEVNHVHEDSLTGAAFVDLCTRRTRRVITSDRIWHWKIQARKFGSAGRRSEEKRYGADGIIEIEVRHSATRTVERKAILIQAKKEWKGKNPRLLDQVRTMEGFAEGSSVVVDYSPDGYSAVIGRDVLEAAGDLNRLPAGKKMPFGKFLADQFLACTVGIRGLYYHPRRRLLILPPRPGIPDAIESIIPERLRIEIQESELKGLYY